jgi:hypothetical protein
VRLQQRQVRSSWCEKPLGSSKDAPTPSGPQSARESPVNVGKDDFPENRHGFCSLTEEVSPTAGPACARRARPHGSERLNRTNANEKASAV